MRTLSEPGGEQQSVPTSPTSSAVTAISGRSSVGMSLQYKGAWCTPPRIFMDHQDEIIPHLEPDTIQPPDKEKKLNQRPARISAWKLAKLDSNEAAKAAAKARASSSLLRPISSRPYPHDADHSSGRSSPMKAGTSRSYPPSQASKEDSMSILSSPQLSNSPMMLQHQQSSNRDHFNPMYEQSPWSAKEREGIHVLMRNNSLAMVAWLHQARAAES